MKKLYPLNKVVAFTFRRRGISVNKLDIVKVTKQLIKAGFSNNIKQKDINIIQEAVQNICRKRHNPLKIAASTSADASIDSCPLCTQTANSSVPMTQIKLVDRTAKYCIEHNVTIPIPNTA